MHKIKALFSGKWFGYALIIIVLCVLGYFGYSYYLQYKEKSKPASNFIPPNPFSIIQINQLSEFQDFVLKNEILSDFDTLCSFHAIRQQFIYFDSLIHKNEQLYKVWKENGLIISSNYTGGENFDLIFIKQLPHPRYSKRIYDFFSEISDESSVVDVSGIKSKIIHATFKNINSSFYICIKDGVFLFSKSLQLVVNSVKISDAVNPLQNDKGYMSVSATVGKSSIANIYINTSFLYRFLTPFVNLETMGYLDFMNNFANWSAFDMSFKENKIMFAGYTSAQDMQTPFLNVFNDNSQQKVTLVSYIPAVVSSYIWFGFDNITSFRNNLSEFYTANSKSSLNDRLENLKSKTKTNNIDELIFPYIDNQLSLISIPRKQATQVMDYYFLAKVKNPDLISENLYKIEQNYLGNKGRLKPDTFNFRGYRILEFSSDYFASDLFGPVFQSVEKSYAVVYKECLLVANSKESCCDYLNYLISGRTLEKSKQFEDFSELISKETNLQLYISPRKIIRATKGFLTNEMSELINQNSEELKNLDGFGIDFTRKSDVFLTNLSFYKNSESSEDISEGWEISIDAPVSSGPWFVKGIDNSQYIILFDSFNQMYYFSESGELLWKIPISERPLSRVFTVDAFKNGKYQYFFNSENYIFLVDRLGKMVDKYPVKLPQKTASSVNVFDYDKNKEYRVVFAGIDNVIYNLSLKGEPTQGWIKPKIQNKAIDSVNYFKLNNSEFLALKDAEKNITFFSRRGQKIFELKELAMSEFSKVYSGGNYCNCLLTTSSDGQLVQIGQKGDLQKKAVSGVGSGHIFLFEDFDSDNTNDFIFIDNGKLSTYNQKFENVISLDLGKDIGRKVIFISQSPYGPLILIFTSDGKSFYLFNKDGKIQSEMKFTASNMADFTFNKGTNRLYIASALDTTIHLFIISSQ